MKLLLIYVIFRLNSFDSFFDLFGLVWKVAVY